MDSGLIEILGEAGIQEKVDKSVLEQALKQKKEIISYVNGMSDKKNRYDHRLYNTLGAIYPSLTRAEKDEALGALLHLLDNMTNNVAQVYSSYIREPLLLADLRLVRNEYWPGIDEGKKIIKKHDDNYLSIRQEILAENRLFRNEKVSSDFCVAYALLRSDTSSNGQAFCGALEPSFMIRAVNGIVNLHFGFDKMTHNEQVENYAHLKKIMPNTACNLIDEFYKEANWFKEPKSKK